MNLQLLTTGYLHSYLIKQILTQGYVSTIAELAVDLQLSQPIIIDKLQELAIEHGVVLQPKTHEVWIIHPFSLAPTQFWVEKLWVNCAWCALGAAELMLQQGKQQVTIRSTFGGEGKAMNLTIKPNKVSDPNLLIHFPIAMAKAWDNVIYSCSSMLFFKQEKDIDLWCKKHHYIKGDVQRVGDFWPFAKEWYGQHLSPDWKKITTEKAIKLTKKYQLQHSIWQIPDDETYF